jgi:hypothetical protein
MGVCFALALVVVVLVFVLVMIFIPFLRVFLVVVILDWFDWGPVLTVTR